MPDTKVLLIVETNGSIDLQHVLALSPDACVFNLGPRDTLIKVLELTFMDQRVFVLGESTATAPSKTNVTTASYNDVTSPTTGLLSAYSYRLGTNSQTALSPRERQILISLAEGKSNKTIARFYNLSEATVKVHLKAILRKTKTHNRTQAAIWAIEHGLRDSWMCRVNAGLLRAGMMASRLNDREHVIPALTDHTEDNGVDRPRNCSPASGLFQVFLRGNATRPN